MQIEEIVLRYSNMLYKICIVMLCNEQDAKDAIQDTFCRYLEKRPDFANDEHEKAWLIRVATNICRTVKLPCGAGAKGNSHWADGIAAQAESGDLSSLRRRLQCKRNCGYSGHYAKCSKEKTTARQRISATIVEGGL